MPKVKYQVRLSAEERKTFKILYPKALHLPEPSCVPMYYWLQMRTTLMVERVRKRLPNSFMCTGKRFITSENRMQKTGCQLLLAEKNEKHHQLNPKLPEKWKLKSLPLVVVPPPEGRSRWPLRLLADKAVELNFIDSIAHEAVGRLLKKRTQAPST